MTFEWRWLEIKASCFAEERKIWDCSQLLDQAVVTAAFSKGSKLSGRTGQRLPTQLWGGQGRNEALPYGSGIQEKKKPTARWWCVA